MIYGIGTDIVSVERIGQLLARHPARGLAHLLHPQEQQEALQAPMSDRFVAKRFAAKEALGKALGTGIRHPLVLPEIGITHDALGKPSFVFSPALAAYFAQRKMTTHLSISDEHDYAVAFVLLETS